MKAFKTIPKEITFDDSELHISWKDGHQSKYTLLTLRKLCPCAVCRGGDFGEIGTMTKNIKTAAIASYNYVGRYAINILWQDGHNTGIFAYQNLRKNCECDQCVKKEK